MSKYRRYGYNNKLKTWQQRHCSICERFLNKEQQKYCTRCKPIMDTEKKRECHRKYYQNHKTEILAQHKEYRQTKKGR